MKQNLISAVCWLLLTFVLLGIGLRVNAQFPYTETFKNLTAKNIVVSGSAKLTAATGIDGAGDGYLRLNENTTNNVGYVYGIDSFPSNYGITATFEFFNYKPGATTTNQADGMTFFLFDASVNAFRPGGTGGSLAYAQYYATPGMAKGYIGISIDEFGNFSSATDGSKNGGPGQRRSSVAIRGPGNGKSVTDYVYQTGVTTTDAAYNIGINGFTQRYPDSTNINYRRIKIIMTPGSTLGSTLGYKVTVIMYKGGATLTPVTLINNFDYPFIAPARLQFGLAASTGSISNYHEIRNLTIGAANVAALLAPVTTDDNGVAACYGQSALVDVTANDVSVNTGGSINKSTVDLNPSVAGIQTTYTDVGKGTYSVDTSGVVSFLGVNGFSGTSNATYTVNDTYGVPSPVASISFNVSNAAAPVLTLSQPSPVCSPASINITSTTYKTATSVGASYNYFSTLSDANAGINNINTAATAISVGGTYYIKASLAGCSTIKPIVVQSAAIPTTANAGPDQSFCSSTGAQTTTLLATNPDIGTGSWSQVSGPAATIPYPDAATTPLYNLAKGVYVLRYTVQNGACPASVDDIQLSVGIPANAGSAQTVVNTTSITMAANAATPATGTWSQVSGPSVGIAEINNASTALTGLAPGNSYVMQWKIINGSCSSTSQVTVTDVLNTIADAGSDQTQAGFADILLHGNTPGLGNIGTWSIITAPAGSLATINLPAIPLAVLGSINKTGDYTLRWTITNGAYSNYDEVSLRVNSVLPVTWLYFRGVEKNGNVLLTWQTGMEHNNDHFNIEKSDDGINFHSIGTQAATNKSEGSSYSFQDELSRKTAPVLYYRITQVDQDARRTYSAIISVHIKQNDRVSVWPNPVTNQMQVRMYTQQDEKIVLTICDATGKTIAASRKNVSAGVNNILLHEFGTLPKGIYYLKITGNQITCSEKILKQ